jgi:hypothetical protein
VTRRAVNFGKIAASLLQRPKSSYENNKKGVGRRKVGQLLLPPIILATRKGT